MIQVSGSKVMKFCRASCDTLYPLCNVDLNEVCRNENNRDFVTVLGLCF